MRRLLTVALVGLAVTAAATDASAQSRPRGRQRPGVSDTARMRRMDSIRVARGDTAFHRRGPDSLRERRLDSLRAAGVIAEGGRGRGRGRGVGPMGPMSGRGGLMGIQLNDDEKAAVKTITEKYREEYKQAREANQGTPPGQNPQERALVQAIADREQAEIRGALTAEHQSQFDVNIAKRKEQAANGRSGRRGQRPPAHGER